MAIHPTAIIDPSAILADDVEIGPHVIVGANCEIGPGCEILAGAIIGANTAIGRNNKIHYHAVIGHDPQFAGWDTSIKSGVRIGDGNELREFCTIHRPINEGVLTTIGNNCYLMGTAHVAHDCVIGNNVTIANYAGLAGHCVVEDNVFISTLAGAHQFCRIGRGAMLGGLSGASKDVPPYMTVKGAIGFIAGVNIVGLKRAGVELRTRQAIRRAYRTLFRSGLSLVNAVAEIRSEYSDPSLIPPELEHLLRFCEAKSKRGVLGGRSIELSTTTLNGITEHQDRLSEEEEDEEA